MVLLSWLSSSSTPGDYFNRQLNPLKVIPFKTTKDYSAWIKIKFLKLGDKLYSVFSNEISKIFIIECKLEQSISIIVSPNKIFLNFIFDINI